MLPDAISTTTTICATRHSHTFLFVFLILYIIHTDIFHDTDHSNYVVGVVFLIVLLCGIPGSQLGRYVTTSICSNNPVQSLMYCNLVFGASTILAASKSMELSVWMDLCVCMLMHHLSCWMLLYTQWIVCFGICFSHFSHTVVLRGPQDVGLCYMFGGCWGMCLGWLQPQNTSSFVPVIPRNQEAEMMGLYILASQMLSWLPPTVFTVMNEMQLKMFYGLGSLSIYFLISMICLFMVGDYLSVVKNTSVVQNSTVRISHGHNHSDSHPSHNSIPDTGTEMISQQKQRSAVLHIVNDNDDGYYPSSPPSSRMNDIAHRELT